MLKNGFLVNLVPTYQRDEWLNTVHTVHTCEISNTINSRRPVKGCWCPKSRLIVKPYDMETCYESPKERSYGVAKYPAFGNPGIPNSAHTDLWLVFRRFHQLEYLFCIVTAEAGQGI
jgi:hypothetical protein